MGSHQILLRTVFAVLSSFLSLVIVVESRAAARSGTVTSTVNLRTGPGVDARVITKVEAGESVKIEAEEGEWLQVSLEGEAFGYRGWVASRFVQAASPETPSPSKAPIGSPPPEPPSPKAQPPAAEPPAPSAPTVQMPAPAPPAAIFQTAADPEKKMAAALSAPPEGDLAPLPHTGQDKEGTPADPFRSAAEKGKPSLAPGQGAPASAAWGAGDALQLLLRLATVLLSCLALIVSVRAYRLARLALSKTEGERA